MFHINIDIFITSRELHRDVPNILIRTDIIGIIFEEFRDRSFV